MNEDNIFVGLDIGTTKIATVVARLDENNILNIVGVGTHPSDGLRRGVVINIDKTVESIKKSIEQAELMAGYKINSVFAGIAGDHIRSINSKGVIAVGGKDRVISQSDVDRVVDAAKAIALPMDRQIVHILTQEFIVDDQDGIKNPIGMAGTRLECEVHIVTASSASIQNIVNCAQKAGYDVDEIVLEPYASSLAVLDNDELDLGVAIMDIGGGTTDLAIFFDGSIRFTSVIGLGGQHVTADLSHGLRTPMEQAEEIKKKYGYALQSMVEEDEIIRVLGIHGRAPREISRGVLCAIIQPRMEEIFSLSMNELERSGMYDSLGAGVVLTGGASLLPGSVELAEKTMGLPVKVGLPVVKGGLAETVKSPMYATGVGLIQYALNRQSEGKQQGKEDSSFERLFQRIKEYFEDLF
jgi:cell division protein FtsA